MTTKIDPAPRATTSRSLRPKHAAEFLDVGLSTFWAWSKRPGFPPLRRLSARCTVVDLHELAAWRDQHPAGDAR